MSKLPIKEPLNIVCLEADINYTIFHLNNGKKVVSSFTLKRFEERPEFSHYLRVNRGTLVNPAFIKAIETNGKTKEVLLFNGQVFNVSRRRLEVVSNLAQLKVS